MEIECPDSNTFYQVVEEHNPRLVLFVVTGQNPNASTAAMAGATAASVVIGCSPWSSQAISWKIGFVGPHVNALPIETLERHPEIDIVFTNEGVYALKNILSTNLSDLELKDIKGIAYRDTDRNIKLNSPEKIVPQHLLEKDLPGIGYDLMPHLSRYRTSNWHANFIDEDRSPFASIYTSLGCIYKCEFCMINIINRTSNDLSKASADFNQFRYWNPEFTITQLDYLAQKGVKQIKIADEMWVLKPKHFETLCDLMKLAWAGGKKAATILGDGAYKFLNVMPDIALNDYGVYLGDSGKDEAMKGVVSQLAQTALQSGQIDFLNVIKVMKADTMTEAEHVLERGMDEMKKIQEMQAEQAQQQAQAEAEAAMAEKQADAQIKQMELDTQIKIAEMNNEDKIQVAEINSDDKRDVEDMKERGRLISEHRATRKDGENLTPELTEEQILKGPTLDESVEGLNKSESQALKQSQSQQVPQQ